MKDCSDAAIQRGVDRFSKETEQEKKEGNENGAELRTTRQRQY